MEMIHQFRKRSRANTDVGKFFTTIEQVRLLLEDLKKWVDSLSQKHDEILAIPLSNDDRNQQLEDINGKIKSLSQVLRTKLKAIEKSIPEHTDHQPEIRECVADVEAGGAEAIPMSSSSPLRRGSSLRSSGYTPATIRIRKMQFASLAKQFSEIMTSYQASQVKYRDQLKIRLKRQLEITNASSVPDKAIEDWIDQGKMTIFTKSIIFDTKVVQDVQARHNDLIKLEKSIRDLNDLFKELAQHVEFQGYVIDNIEESVARTVSFAEAGRKNLTQARIYRDNFRKKKAWLLTSIGVGTAMLILGVIIYLSITRKI